MTSGYVRRTGAVSNQRLRHGVTDRGLEAADALRPLSEDRRQELIRACHRSLDALRTCDDAAAKRLIVDLESLELRLLLELDDPERSPEGGTAIP